MRQITEVAERENATVDSIIALSSQVTAWQVRDAFEQRAKRRASSDLGAILATISDVPPVSGNEK